MNQSTLMCNKVGHQRQSIVKVCLKQGCQAPKPCCQTCLLDDHQNHSPEDFEDIFRISEQFTSNYQYLIRLSDICQSIVKICQEWKEKISQLIINFKENSDIVQNPTLTQIKNWVLTLQNQSQVQIQKQDTIVKLYKQKMNKIKFMFQELYDETNSLFLKQINSQKQIQEERANSQNEEIISNTIRLKLNSQKYSYQHLNLEENDYRTANSKLQSQNQTQQNWFTNLNNNNIFTLSRFYPSLSPEKHKKSQYQQKSLRRNDAYYPNFIPTFQLIGNQKKIGLIDISHNNKFLASEEQKFVTLWNIKRKEAINQFKSKYSIITALQFSDDDTMLAIGSFNTYEKQSVIEIFDIFNINNCSTIIQLKIYNSRINRISFTDKTNKFILFTVDKTLIAWDLEKKSEINQWNRSNSQLNGLAYSRNKSLLAFSGDKGEAYLFECKDLRNFNFKQKWQAFYKDTQYMEFIEHSKVLMISSEKETKFWQVKDILSQNIDTFKSIKEGGWTIKAHPIDNPSFIINVNSNNKYLSIWSYDSCELVRSVNLHTVLICRCFAMTSNFLTIITGGENGKIHFFQQDMKGSICITENNEEG